MAAPRRLNDFDNFISNNQPMFSPRQQPLTTLHNYNSNTSPYRPHPDSHRHMSPNKINMTRKPMISPSRSPRKQPVQKGKGRQEQVPIRSQQSNWQSVQDRFCSNENHPHKKAQYFINIEDEDMYYCGVCATQAASQGFAVNRINNSRGSKKVSNRKARVLPNYPKYANNTRYHQIMDFLKNIITVEEQCQAIDPEQINRHYQEQEALLDKFYAEIKTIVDMMREDHLADLREEQKKSCQEALLKQGDLRGSLEEIGQTWEDICCNIHDIVQNVDQPSYATCMNAYQNSIQMFSHQLEEYSEMAQNFTTYQASSLDNKVKAFEKKLTELFEEEEQQQPIRAIQGRKAGGVGQYSDRSKTVKTVHEMLPSRNNHHNGEGQGAFRNLFPQDEGEERLPEASPQFKAF